MSYLFGWRIRRILNDSVDLLRKVVFAAVDSLWAFLGYLFPSDRGVYGIGRAVNFVICVFWFCFVCLLILSYCVDLRI